MSSLFGIYELGTKLGTGDMGTVYQAKNTRTDETVALKVLDQFDLASRIDREAAVDLIEFTATIKHERLQPILEALESGDDNGKIGVVMPLAPNRSLWEYLSKGKKVAPKVALSMIGHLGVVLEFLHGQEVAHGSLKPSNVLLDQNGNPCVTDLAMAHLREFGLVPKEPTLLQRYYQPPEATYDSPPETIGDVFSLGVLTYHTLTGRIPFNDPDPEAREVPSGEDLPPLIYYVLLRAMTDRKRLRYQTISEFIQDLKGAMKGEIDPETVRLFKVERPSELEDE